MYGNKILLGYTMENNLELQRKMNEGSLSKFHMHIEYCNEQRDMFCTSFYIHFISYVKLINLPLCS